jgi:hypothetical protein
MPSTAAFDVEKTRKLMISTSCPVLSDVALSVFKDKGGGGGSLVCLVVLSCLVLLSCLDIEGICILLLNPDVILT